MPDAAWQDATTYTGDWAGCYDGGWGDLIVPEAYQHPAKFAYGVICRIIDHGLERGYWCKGDLIADPFGGIGSGGIVATYKGIRWIGVELEPHFVDLARENFALHAAKWKALGAVPPVIIQGDSRNFASLVAADGICTSPSYAESDINPGNVGNRMYDERWGKGKGLAAHPSGYGSSPGQIGRMPAGSLDAVLSSPPYAETGSGGNARTGATNPDKFGPNSHSRKMGPSHHQIGYGSTPGNLGNSTGDTYWRAVAQVYEQCRLAMKPGGVICVVVKSYVKAGKIVDLPGQTWELLQRIGFKPLERIRAMLTKTTETPGLYGKMTKTKKRASFFRRLAERKGSPPVDWEEVLYLRKPDELPLLKGE